MLTKLDVLAILANGFAPTDYDIEQQFKYDKMRNPYNESRKPKLRDRIEIIVDFKINAAKMLYHKLENEQ